MSEYEPTSRLRWVREYADRDDVVRGMIPGWPETGPSYYKLQQWWERDTMEACPPGEWRDVPIERE